MYFWVIQEFNSLGQENVFSQPWGEKLLYKNSGKCLLSCCWVHSHCAQSSRLTLKFPYIFSAALIITVIAPLSWIDKQLLSTANSIHLSREDSSCPQTRYETGPQCSSKQHDYFHNLRMISFHHCFPSLISRVWPIIFLQLVVARLNVSNFHWAKNRTVVVLSLRHVHLALIPMCPPLTAKSNQWSMISGQQVFTSKMSWGQK